MSTVNPSQLPDLITDVGIGVMLESYAAEAPVWSMICDVTEVSATAPPEGMAEAVVAGGIVPRRTKRGAEAEATTMEEAYTWQMAIPKVTERIEITEEMFSGPNARAVITAHVQSAFRGWGKGWAIYKERTVAALFNRGPIAAGDASVFDNSYTNRADPYAKFIYDGKPFLAASGNGHPLGLATATTKYNHTASAALSSANLEAARILMEDTNAVDEIGEKVLVRASHLLVPAALSQTARVLLGSELAPGTAQNDINTFADGQIRPLVWRYLTDTDGWILYSRGVGGIKAADSGPAMRIETSAPDGKSGNVTLRGIGYFGAAVANWRCAVGNNIATS